MGCFKLAKMWRKQLEVLAYEYQTWTGILNLMGGRLMPSENLISGNPVASKLI